MRPTAVVDEEGKDLVSDIDTQPETVVLAPRLRATYRDQLNTVRHELGAILGSEHPSVAALREAIDKLGDPGIPQQHDPDRPTRYSPG